MKMKATQTVTTGPKENVMTSPWFMRFFTIILDKPAAALVIIFLLFIGMLTGYIPNKNDTDIMVIKQNQIGVDLKLDALKVQIQVAADAASMKDANDSKLLRGICFILAQQSTGSQQQTLLQYCNP